MGPKAVESLVTRWRQEFGEELLPRLLASARRARSLPHDGPGLSDAPAELLLRDDVLGLVHQGLQQEALQRAYRGTARERRKFEAGEIAAVTQLFTPRWVVEFLLHNTLGRLWREMHPDSRLELPWLVPGGGEATPGGTARMSRPARTLRILDPACGTMNFGVVAFELLERMYREEIDRAGEWGAPSVADPASIPVAILQNNLFGIDIDPGALRLATETLALKAGVSAEQAAANLRLADALAETPAGDFDAVVTNPPYLSARNMDKDRVRLAKHQYPSAWRDLYACFIDLCLRHLRSDGGRAGLLTMQSFMFTGSFARLRREIFGAGAIESVVRMGPGLFDGGNPGTLQTAAFVLRRESDAALRDGQRIAAFDLGDQEDKRAALQRQLATPRTVTQGDLARGPRGAWALHAPEWALASFGRWPRLGTLHPVRQGLATTDNARFVRYWWEVDCPPAAPVQPTPGRWTPYAKGGGFRRWYWAPRHVVNWQDDGREIKQAIVERYPYLGGEWAWVAKNSDYYGRAGVTWSYLTSHRFSARLLPAGCIFDVAASSLFPGEPERVLGLLNSSVAAALLAAINPTINFQVGDLAEVPVAGLDPAVVPLVREAVEIQRSLEQLDETSREFAGPLDWADAEEVLHARLQRLAEVEAEIEAAVRAAYRVPEAPALPRGSLPANWRGDLARRWVSWGVGSVVGRWDASGEPRAWRIDDLAGATTELLLGRLGAASLGQIERELRSVEHFLARDFANWHAKLYGARPIYWRLDVGEKQWLVPHWAATASTLRGIGLEVPSGWERSADDGIAVSLAALGAWSGRGDFRRQLRGLKGDLARGRFDWSETARRVRGGAV